LSSIRKALGESAEVVLTTEGESVVLGTECVHVDVDVDAVLMGAELADPAKLEHAASYAQGILLKNLVFGEDSADDWIRDERVRLQNASQQLLFRVAERQSRAGDHAGLLQTYTQIISLNPVCEEAHRQLMSCYVKLDRRSDALAQYHSCQDLLSRHMDAEPSAETTRQYDELRRGSAATEEVPVKRRHALPLPDKPAIAVLAFDNLSGDSAHDYISDGFSEDITTSLSQFASLCVIARNSAFAYKGRGLTIPQIGRELGVHYALEGSVRIAGERVRVSAQLIDADNDELVWSQRYDGIMSDVFEFQDDIVQRIVATSVGRIEAKALERAKRKSSDDLDAYDCVLRGKYHHHRCTLEDSTQAVELFEKAIKAKPDYTLAHGWLACAKARKATYRESLTRAAKFNSPEYLALIDREQEKLKDAITLDEEESECLRLIGEIYLFQRNYDAADRYIRRALRFNPNDDRILAQMAALLAFRGELEEALGFARQSMRVNPFYPGFYCFNLGRILLLLGRYEEAIEALRDASPPQNRYRAYLAAAYVADGQAELAQQVRQEILDGDPHFSLRYFGASFIYRDAATCKNLLELMRKAGLPE
jgi:TolB-like protein